MMQSLTRLLLATGLTLSACTALAGDKIKVYFNYPVDVSVSTGTDAVNLNGKIDDTLAAYIDRAKYTLDIAVYNFTSTATGLPLVYNAVNNAYSRGVKVRWIYDASQTNSGMAYLNSGIARLGSPTGTGYGIMHNKFLIVDANSSNPGDAVVWTGSTNWSVKQFDYDYDNVVIVQDSALAHAYRAQFNMMWGDTGMTPNSAAAKFGPDKTDLGRHNFTVDGKQVELYFSPSDNTNTRITSAINTADKDLYFGLYIVTDANDANAIIARKNAGVYTAGIIDAYGTTAPGEEYSVLLGALGSGSVKSYNGGSGSIYHNKYLIVDPSDACADPLVLTGSHNWTFSADTKNDENTLIIHDASLANQFYQSFRADFATLGGSLATITGCPTGVSNVSAKNDVMVFPNPADNDINIQITTKNGGDAELALLDITGKLIYKYNEMVSAGRYTKTIAKPAEGLYVLKVKIGNDIIVKRVVVN